MNQLEKLFSDIFAGEELVYMVFSGKRKKSLEYNKVTFRPKKISGALMFQEEYTFEKSYAPESERRGRFRRSLPSCSRRF